MQAVEYLNHYEKTNIHCYVVMDLYGPFESTEFHSITHFSINLFGNKNSPLVLLIIRIRVYVSTYIN